MPFTIRIATPDDAQAIHAIYAPYCGDSPVSFEFDPPTIDEMRQRIANLLPRFPWLVMLADGGQIAGYVYASPHRDRPAYRWCVEAASYTHPDFHRRGVGRSLYTVLFELLRMQNIVNVYAGITVPNAASVGLHESLGFKQVARYPAIGYKGGCWLNVGWWALRLRDGDGPPDLPRSFSEIRDWPRVAQLLSAAV